MCNNTMDYETFKKIVTKSNLSAEKAEYVLGLFGEEDE